jgi:membrane protein insertase Oxa1/YidC/SpoIIIJ
MRKQNIKMKENQERMAKLQKQYANNKDLYNQKVMELYKESGINMFSSCLPMILSMVIFFVAIGAFNSYSQYANAENYNIMVNAYNEKLLEYTPELSSETVTENGSVITVDSSDCYIYYTLDYAADYAKDDYAYVANTSNMKKQYFVHTDRVYAAHSAEIEQIIENSKDESGVATKTKESACVEYLENTAQDAVVVAYEEKVTKNMSFLWIKNIWATDAAYKHPIMTYTDFSASFKNEKFDVGGEKKTFDDVNSITDVYKETTYELVTENLTEQKAQANGYFVLILLSIGTILLQQWISMRGQKEQMQYSSVDGQGASQQKITMITMTVMFAIFSFMYSAAFSIYMITSNLFSLASTLLINFFVDKKLKKEGTTATVARMDNRRLSRIEAAKNAGKASAQNTKEKKNKDEESQE